MSLSKLNATENLTAGSAEVDKRQVKPVARLDKCCMRRDIDFKHAMRIVKFGTNEFSWRGNPLMPDVIVMNF